MIKKEFLPQFFEHFGHFSRTTKKITFLTCLPYIGITIITSTER